MAKIKLGHRVVLHEKQIFVGTVFSMNENGGMGGAHYRLYAEGEPSDYIKSADNNGMVRIIDLKGYERYINLRWCNEVVKINICKVVVPETKWNHKYGSECDHLLTGEIKTFYFDIGLNEDVEFTSDTSSEICVAKEDCSTID